MPEYTYMAPATSHFFGVWPSAWADPKMVSVSVPLWAIEAVIGYLFLRAGGIAAWFIYCEIRHWLETRRAQQAASAATSAEG